MFYNHLWFLLGAILSVHSEAFMTVHVGTGDIKKITSLSLEIIVMIMNLFFKKKKKHIKYLKKNKQNWFSGTPSLSPPALKALTPFILN